MLKKALIGFAAIAIAACTSFGQISGPGGTPSGPVYPADYDYMYDPYAAGKNVTIGDNDPLTSESLFVPSSMQTHFDYPYINNPQPTDLFQWPEYDSSNTDIVDWMETIAESNYEFFMRIMIQFDQTVIGLEAPPESSGSSPDDIPVELTDDMIDLMRNLFPTPREVVLDLIEEFCYSGGDHGPPALSSLQCSRLISQLESCDELSGTDMGGGYHLECEPEADWDPIFEVWSVDCNCSSVETWPSPPLIYNITGVEVRSTYNTILATSPYTSVYSSLIADLKAINHAYITDINDLSVTANQAEANYILREMIVLDEFIDDMQALWDVRNP